MLGIVERSISKELIGFRVRKTTNQCPHFIRVFIDPNLSHGFLRGSFEEGSEYSAAIKLSFNEKWLKQKALDQKGRCYWLWMAARTLTMH